MLIRKIILYIREMPRSAYLFLRAVLILSDGILLCAFSLFAGMEAGSRGYKLYRLAVTLLETPAALLLLGLVGTAFFIDRS